MAAGERPPLSARNAVLLLLAVCAVLYFPGLGSRDLWAPDEPRFAEVAREMFASGDYVVPRRNGKPYIKKPPFFFWSVCLVGKLAGEVNEYVARIPSALAATALVLATFFWARWQLGANAALLTSLVLATTFRFYWNARYIQTDMVFSFLTGAAIFAIFTGYIRQERAWRWCLIGYAAAGLAVLAKGPLALVLVFLALGPFMVWRQWRLREFPKFGRWLPHLVGVAICLAIAAPWYLLSAKAVGGAEFAQKNLIRENWTRFANAFDHQNPFYEYLILLPLDFLPWSIFLPAGLALVWRSRREEGETKWLADFLLLWLGLSFLFFSISQSKQGKYLLPLYPGFALIVGWLLSASLNQLAGRPPTKAVSGSFWVCFTALLLGAVAANVVLCFGWPGMADKGLTVEDFRALIPPFAPASVIAVVGAVMGMLCLARGLVGRAFMVLLGMLAVGYLAVSVWGLPAVDPHKTARPICEELKALAGPADRVGYAGPSSTNDAYVYYTERTLTELEGGPEKMDREVRKFAVEPGRAFLFIRREHYSQLSGETKRPWAIVARKQVGHREMLLLRNEEVARPNL